MTAISNAPSATVVLDGEIDIATAPAIRRFLMAAISGDVHLAVDMSDVTFIDAAGIGILVAAANRAREAGGGLSLLAPSRQLRRLLGVLHLDAILPTAQRSGGPDADPDRLSFTRTLRAARRTTASHPGFSPSGAG